MTTRGAVRVGAAMSRPQSATVPRAGWFFAYDWDLQALQRLGQAGLARCDIAGFDLFTFPSNAALIGFDLEGFAARQAQRGRRLGWRAELSHHEQFGTLAAALVAERLGLPGASPESILAAQHKLHARRMLQQVAPEALDHVPGRGHAPGRLAEHVAEDEQPAVAQRPGRGVAAELDGEGRAAGAEAAVLRLVTLRIGLEHCAVLRRGEVVAALRQVHAQGRIAALRLPLREVGHRVVAQQHHRLAGGIRHGGVGCAATGQS